MNLIEETLNRLLHDLPQFFEVFNANHTNNINSNEMEIDQTGGVLNYQIDNTFNNYNKKFNCTTSTYNISFSTNAKPFTEAHSDIENAFNALHAEFSSKMLDKDKIRVVFFHDSLDRPISHPFMSKSQLTPTGFLENFEHVAQSYKSVKLNENNNLTTSVVIAHLPIGSGRKMYKLVRKRNYQKKIDRQKDVNFSAFQEFCNKKPGIKTVFNHVNLCALRAILIAKAFTDKDPYRFELCKPNNLIENYLKNYQITVISCDGKLDKMPIYIGEPKDKFIYISYTGSHYNVITSMKSFYNRSYYCNYCKIAYQNAEKHKCRNKCNSCNRSKCPIESLINCEKRNLQCYSEKCYNIHKEKTCINVKNCKDCNSFKGRNHVCNENHKLSISCCIFFEYEAYVENGVHNLVIAKKVCIECLNENSNCQECEKKFVFYDNKVMIVFIINHIISSFLPTDTMPHILLSGTKVLSIKFRKLKLIDSYSFLSCPLSEFLNTFNLQDMIGYFPHKFNLPENQNYIGDYPDISYYGSEFFSQKKKKDFENWYETVKNDCFTFREQFHAYCWSDVMLLTNESNGIIPENRYHPEQKTSIKCQLWLKYLSKKHKIEIRHSKNSGEVSIRKYKIDGYCEQTNTFFEFHGCLFHGCQKCYKSDTFNPFKQESMETTYNRHLNRINFIKNSINDFTSLYPAVQKYCRYPNIVTENLGNIRNYFGIITCKVLPPIKLFFPVLPARINNKLVFTLCQACAEENMSKCEHSVEKRSFESTWITLEIEEALNQRYEIVEIYEVWHWEKTALYNKETKSGGLISDYVDMFLKGKQEADGFLDSAKTREEKELYIKNYFEREGILLDNHKIEYNKGLRSVMKVLINSFWGRFGMNTNKTQYRLISHPDEWFEMISNDQYIIHDVDFSYSNFIQVFYSIDDDMHDGGIHTSVTLAAFVTCHARLKLYQELKKNWREDGEYKPEVGDYLGKFTDDVKKKGADHIVEFISAGPKNYAYKLDNGKTSCTVKGFTLNHLSSLSINFDAIKDIVLNDRSKKIKVEQQKFTRDKLNWIIKTNLITKLYGFVYDKHILLDDLSTIPFGY
ncbi:unnamed protein product [Brachionus calyciflorus]|uniref:DNA-directed DNA polymerase n=1 Tax=Brachionus calyciflorus TaxID=104777 RepID=A0A814E3E8_9BILA|nr:unnamed protein product [Brachionus calyciflorus]